MPYEDRMIDVRCIGDADPLEFLVNVRQGGGESRHHVTLSRETAARLTDRHPAETCVEAAFRFLLDREPKESILGRFDIAVIAALLSRFRGATARVSGRPVRAPPRSPARVYWPRGAMMRRRCRVLGKSVQVRY